MKKNLWIISGVIVHIVQTFTASEFKKTRAGSNDKDCGKTPQNKEKRGL